MKPAKKQHQRRLNSYNEVQAQVQSSVEAMDANFAAAQEVLLATWALISDVNNNVIYGWYKPKEEVESVENNPDYARSSIGAIPAFGIGIGTPAAIWTLVGIYGTAATGDCHRDPDWSGRRLSYCRMDWSRRYSGLGRNDGWAASPWAPSVLLLLC